MRFALSAALLTAALSHPSMACDIPQLAPNSQIPKTFIYEKGWTIPGLARASIVRKYRDDSGSDVIVYKPTKTVLVEMQGLDLSMDGKSLRLVPGYVQWVTDITEHRVQGRTYAYSVQTVSLRQAEPPMFQQVQTATPHGTRRKFVGGVLGCGWTVVRYFDADGDGRFESLEYVGFGGPYTNSTRCPTTPEWALKLLPNRAAAERCAKEVPARDLNTSELPLVLRNILDYRPGAPVLVPVNESQTRNEPIR